MGKRQKDLQLIIDLYGKDSQRDMAIEECAELITVLSHWKRDKTSAEDVAGEIADVGIMVDQLTMVFGTELLATIRKQKIDRLLKN